MLNDVARGRKTGRARDRKSNEKESGARKKEKLRIGGKDQQIGGGYEKVEGRKNTA